MKLQNMTIIFSIIVIPITLILSAYIGVQIDTAALMQQYDTKLMAATHDAIVAFELNTMNNQYSTNADSIRRDIKAAINTFSTSLASGFGTAGESKASIMPYIPALVFTLYDGYYIYSPNQYNYEANGEIRSGYEHILKPYIHYTARYKSGNNDITINYSLDNYITVYGYLAGKGYVSKSGYLINPQNVIQENGVVTGYRIHGSILQTNVAERLSKLDETGKLIETESTSAKQYFQESYDFTKWVLEEARLQTFVTPNNAIKSDGSQYEEFQGDNTAILALSSQNDPEERSSSFNQHKKEIMRKSIQENLNHAIKVYNDHSPSMGTHANFRMPILTEEDWEKILTNVNMISFMEGIPVGTKIYNNYTIVTSTKNKQYINPNSLYFIDNTNTYHRIHCQVLKDNIEKGSTITGYKSIDFEKRENSQDPTKYYYQYSALACYECMINTLSEDIDPTTFNKMQFERYYRALARERYDLDKITKMLK